MQVPVIGLHLRSKCSIVSKSFSPDYLVFLHFFLIHVSLIQTFLNNAISIWNPRALVRHLRAIVKCMYVYITRLTCLTQHTEITTK